MRLDQPRFAPLGDDELAAEHIAALGGLAEDWRGLNIFRTVVRAPGALAGMLSASHYVRSQGLPAREREIVILRIGYLCMSGYEWTQHVFLGRQAGVSKDEMRALKAGADAPNWTAADRALIRACDELQADQFISSPTWSALGEHFTDKQCLDVIFTAGHYVQVSMIVNTLGIQLDEGQWLDPDLLRLER